MSADANKRTGQVCFIIQTDNYFWIISTDCDGWSSDEFSDDPDEEEEVQI